MPSDNTTYLMCWQSKTYFLIKNNHTNNVSALIESPDHVLFYKNMCKRIPLVSSIFVSLRIYLIRERVTERSFTITFTIDWERGM